MEVNEAINALRRERYATDPEFRARERERNRLRKQTERFRALRRARWRERYATDPEYRERCLRQRREAYQRAKAREASDA